MRELWQRLRTCDAGAGIVEYGILIAVVALGIIGVLSLYRKAVAGVATKSAVTVSQQAGGSYGTPDIGGGGGSAWVGQSPDHAPESPEPDSTSTDDRDPADDEALVR